MWIDSVERKEYVWFTNEEVTKLQDLIRQGILKNIIMNPSNIEFKLHHWSNFVWVFDKWEFVCFITREDYHQIVDEDSIVNTHFNTIKSILNKQ